MKTLLRPHILTALLGGVLLSACLFGNSPSKLNDMIDKGDAARALTTIEEKLTDNGTDPALNLLAIKARLALCKQRNCADTPGTTPALLTGLPKLAANVTGPVTLAKNTPPLTLSDVFTSAMAQYQTATPQPAAVLALYNSAPVSLQPSLASGLFQPALTLARAGNAAAASQVLGTLGTAEGLPSTYSYAAHMLDGMFSNDSAAKEPNLIALRSATAPRLPTAAAALLPWAVLEEATTADSPTEPSAVLGTLPQRLAALKLPNLLDATAMSAIAQELVTASQTPSIAARWQNEGKTHAALKLQRMALAIDPNQPALWATYLPALVSATIIAPSSTSLDGLTSLQSETMGTHALPAVTLTSASAPRVATEVIRAANQLVNYPGVATPLVTFASRLPLSKQQQIDLEKLSQSLIIKAAEQNDITSTLVLAQTLPGVAQNNRQSVVPLLVKFIRANLHAGNFTAATNTADFLTKTLQMDIEFAPLVLEEFADDLKARGIPDSLNAKTPEILLQPAETVVVDLGPIFTFMQTYFEDQPKVISAQLTTLIAGATGAYGQPTAMYRLGSYFPESTLPAAKQQEWLAASLEQSLLADTSLNATQLADTAARLSAVHPGMNLAPLMETAIKRAGSLEDQRTLWQSSTPSTREVLRAIRPEFTMLMQGVDALAAGQLNTSAQSLSGITDGTWRTEAQPFIEQFNDRLLTLSGIYVPVSAAPTFKTAAIILAPQGLQGGKLNSVSVTFISRLGTLNESEPTALRTNAAAVHRFSLPVTYNFDNRSLSIQPLAVAQAPQGGTFGPTFGNVRTLKLQTGTDDTTAPLLNVTLADGSTTTFVRTLIDPTQALKPDGTYLLQARMGTMPSSTLGILPPGSMLTMASTDNAIPAPEEADTTTALVYPVTGSVRHPAAANPITFTGYYDADLLTTTFIFNYPLPASAQPARAAVRCQALAGPVTCGAHNLNSARQAYAAMVTGLQTRESLATSALQRNTLNSTGASRILANAVPVIATPSTTLSVSSTGGLLAPPSFLAMPSATLVTSATTISVTIAMPSPSTLVSTLLPATHVSGSTDDTADEEAPTPTPKRNRFSDEPEPGAFVNHSGGNGGSSTTPAATSTPSAPKTATAPIAAPAPAPAP